jgi:2-dehydro-3-deoxyphosphogluconate aldolase/(4S)-4-hydroxy-2-oxoglutarate aldolase
MFDRLALAGLIPVIKVDRAEDAVPLCRALVKGGLPVAEITFRTSAAEDAIRLVHDALPEILLGAGTVLTAAQADRAWAVGARYIVSPGMNASLVRHCLDKGYTILPGCAGPSDIEAALEMGLDTVKFFPAESLGGTNMIKALLGPYHHVKFVPTGGVNEQNLLDYLSIPNVLACGGSWMLPSDAIKNGDWERVERLAAEAVRLLLGFEIRHVGMNHDNPGQAAKTAEMLGLLTGWPMEKDSPSSCFIGTGFELMKKPWHGLHGHIAISTNNFARARWHLERRGFTFDESSVDLDKAGNPRVMYLNGEIGGFAFHLVQK